MHPAVRISSGSSPVTSSGAASLRQVVLTVMVSSMSVSFAADPRAAPSSLDLTLVESTQLRTALPSDPPVGDLGDRSGAGTPEMVPGPPASSNDAGDDPRLPDEEQQQLLEELLARVSANPDDTAAFAQLEQLLVKLLDQARAALDGGRREEARAVHDVVAGIVSLRPELEDSRVRVERSATLDRLLTAGRAALAEGRIDEPEHNSAWYYFRQAQDLEPYSTAAKDGLLRVQRALIRRALDDAENGEFDSAERWLEVAADVFADSGLVDVARSEVALSRNRHAEQLETRANQVIDDGDLEAAERLLIDLVALGGQRERVSRLRSRIEEASIYGGYRPGEVVRDPFLKSGLWAPAIVIVVAGSFIMGSPASERGRVENEGPPHRVTFERGFAIGQREVTVGEFRRFVEQTGYRTDAEHAGKSTIFDQFSGRLTERQGIDWQSNYEGKPAEPDDPVVHVSWNDAQAYVDWLATGTGRPYRLPSEAEFEYALRAGTSTRYWWGDSSPPRVVENLTGDGDSTRSRRGWKVAFTNYADRHWGPAPVASFVPSPFGLYDMGGNVGEWVQDCWHDTYLRAPADGSAWVNPGCSQRVVRGGYWASSPDQTRSAHRLFARSDFHDARIGFRIARDL